MVSHLLVVLISLYFQLSSQVTVTGDYIFPDVQIEPFYLKYLKFDLGNLLDKMKFKVDFDFVIYQDSSTILPYEFPLMDQINNLNDFTIQIRLFNFGSTSITITLVANCLRSTNDCDLEALSRIMTIRDSQPQYADVGTSKLFAITLNKEFLSGIRLPSNLYNPSDQVIIDFPIETFPPGLSYENLTTTETVYDTSYWNDFTTVLIPWVPFFTYCGGQDKRLYFYDILENNPTKCAYVPAEDTKIIGTIPTGGFEPKSDSCHIVYKCYHRDTGLGKSFGTPWYSIKEDQTLYHIHRKPITITEALERKTDLLSGFFKELIEKNDGDMIPVIFTNEDKLSSGYPQKVLLKIRFFQASKTEKQILTVQVILDDFTGTSAATNFEYELTISYQAVNYFSMINSFKVGIAVYLFVFLLVSLALCLGAYFLWRLNKLIFSRRERFLPTLKFFATFKITFSTELIGTLYAGICTVLIFTFLLSYLSDVVNLSNFSYDFHATAINSTELLQHQRGRIGLACVFFAFFILFKGASLIIPVPTKEEAKIIDENMNKDESKDDSDEDSSISEKSDPSVLKQTEELPLLISKELKMDGATEEGKKEDEMTDEDKYMAAQEEKKNRISMIITYHERKRYHYFLISLLMSIILLFVITPKKVAGSSTATFLMIELLFIDVLVILILKNAIFQEILLLAPVTMAFEIVQFIVVMRAETFVLFIAHFLFRQLLITLFRIYLDPKLKNLEIYYRKLVLWLSSKRGFTFLSGLVDKSEEQEEQERWKNIELILQKPINKSNIFSIEFIVFTLVNFTTKQAARFMFPLLLLFNYVFPNETQITNLYGVKRDELVYYIIFWTFILIPSFIMDTYLLNVLEIIHGHKLYDYLSYCEYKFNFRDTKWIANTKKMDRAVSREHRSIHNFCFSKQFYFTISVGSWGILFMTIGLYMVIANKHAPFKDAAFVPMFFLIYLVFACTKFLFSKLANHFDLWKLPKKKIKEVSKRIENEKKRLENNNDLDKLMLTKAFRESFIKANKPWIIKNMKHFLSVENFYENEGYLLRLYRSLEEEEIKEKNERKRRELISKKKHEHMAEMAFKDLVEEHRRRVEGEYYMPEEKVLRIKKSVIKPMIFLVHHWYFFAKQNIYLRNLIADIDVSKLKSKCDKCSQEYTLKVVPKIPITDLVTEFRLKYAGLPFNKYEWRNFYEKNQKFRTLCDDCQFIAWIKKFKGKKGQPTSTTSQKEKSEESQKLTTEPIKKAEPALTKKDLPSSLKKTLFIWRMTANARRMHGIKALYPQDHRDSGEQAPCHRKHSAKTPVRFPSPTETPTANSYNITRNRGNSNVPHRSNKPSPLSNNIGK